MLCSAFQSSNFWYIEITSRISGLSKLVFTCHKQRFKHFNFQYIYLISYKIAKKANPMNCSAASRGVSGALEQLQLFLVKLFIFIFFSLLLNICFDDCLIAFFADWTYVISISPELASPEVLFDWWYSAKYFSSCYALYRSHYFCWAISRYRLNQKVNMVPICTNL